MVQHFSNIFLKATAIFLFVMLFNSPTQAQFYNGHQMTFGKNRVQYGNFFWRYYRYDKFDTYFYEEGKGLSERVATIADKKVAALENYFAHTISKRIIFLCYNSMSDFRQSNIGYNPDNEESNTGGVTRIIRNKVFIYYEGSEKKLEQQVTKAIAEVIINEILYGGSYRQRLTNSSLMVIPEWFTEGLTDYISQEWNTEIENKVKEGFQSGRYEQFNHLNRDDAKTAGHSLWYFTAQTYGKDVIPNIVYLTRVNRSADNGFLYVLGSTVKEITPEWTLFFDKQFKNALEKGVLPNENDIVIKARRQRALQQVKSSPNGQYIAYVTNEKGKTKIWIYDTKTQKKKKIYRSGNKIEQITDFSYPVLGWHPNGEILSFIMEEKGDVQLYSYFIKTKQRKKRSLLHFRKVLSFDYSPNGMMLAISGVQNNQTDIFVMSLTAGTSENITSDLADDFNPVWVQNADKILFSSNRINDSIYDAKRNTPVRETYDLFMYNYKLKSKHLERITNTANADEKYPVKITNNKFISLSNKNGIDNRQIIQYDSTISYIDTAVHYRYYSTTQPITNYSQNIEKYDFGQSQQLFYDVMRKNGQSYIYQNRFSPGEKPGGEKFMTPYIIKKNLQLKQAEKDRLQKIKDDKAEQLRLESLKEKPTEQLIHPDKILVDINNYTFEKDSKSAYYKLYPITDSVPEISLKVEEILQRNYLTHFYIDRLTQQLDIGYLNASYQVFTGSAFYFNNSPSLFFKLGITDLFEDYKITGGFRMGSIFNSYEYLLSVENLKKRLDKQLIYHKQILKSQRFGNAIKGKLYSDELLYILKYPLSQVASLRLTTSARYDKNVILTSEFTTLTTDDWHQFFTGIKGEYIFDNTIKPSLNLHEGLRGKVFFEFYQEADQKYTNMFVTGVDFRWYKKIHRSLTFASRLAASSSFGKSKLIYYLGGVDNWYSLNPENRFDQSVEIDKEENYVYQAVATNMRGFPQNARNGTNFTVLNNEIRFPIVKYLINRPVSNDFINNFQIIAFADAGAAWSGASPFSKENAYNTQTITRNPVSVIINKNRPPVIFGYGLGIRSRLWGYFFRLDWAYGVEYDVIHPRIIYLSLGQDF